MRRLTLPLAVVAGVWFWLTFGALQVPKGMDTMPSAPPGSSCLIDKRAGRARVGHEVFVDVPDGGTVLTRVLEVTADDLLVLRHDNAESRLPDSRAFGPLPRSAVRGIVLCVFAPDPAEPEVPNGR